jgi:PAS domain S-box-containing protein
MLTIDDLFISLSVLICFRLSAFIVFFSRYFRENKSRYGAISLGWLVYAVGPVFGLLEYINTGDFNHPIFGYSAAVGTFLLMFGILLYHFKVTLQWFVNLFLFFVIGFGLLLSFYPEMSGIFGVTAQLLLIVSTLIIVVFKRKWLITISGKASYIWLCLFLLLSLLHAFGFNFWYSEMPISLRFAMTFITNLFLYIFLLDFDWEQSLRKMRVNEAKLKASLKEKETLLQELENKIVERKQAEEAVENTMTLLRACVETPTGMIICAIDRQYRYLFFNSVHKEGMHNAYGTDIVKGMSIFDFIANDKDRKEVKADFDRSLAGDSHISIQEYGENAKAYYENICSPIVNDNGEIIGAISFSSDISERKQTEVQIKASLKEKETLLQEIHHRVKNNMNVISSLLKLQSNNIEDDQIKEVLKDSQSRVYAMSAVHETLHGSEKLSEIDLKSYLSKITSAIFQTYSTDNKKAKLNCNIDDVPISLNQAYPLGLVINELISNSLKYAFPKDSTGEITVQMKKQDKELELIVMDDGVGMPDGMDWKNSSTLGLKLVRTLVENQLDGTIDLDNTNGTKFTIKFNIET